MDIDYNKLKVFLEVVESGGVTAAAKKLYRTQSAVSQAISSLEQQLGVKLITWEGKRLQLTREGQLVYKAAQPRIEAIDEQLLAIKNVGDIVSGCIEIGMLHDHSTDIHLRTLVLIASFREKYPHVFFRIHFGTSREIEQALLARDIDIGLYINIQQAHRFSLFEVATEQHLIVTSPKYLKRAGSVKSVQEVVEQSLIDIDPYFTCFTPWVKHHDPEALVLLEKKQPAIVVADFLSIRQLVLEAQGVAVLPKYLIEKELKKGAIVHLLPKLEPLRVWVSCVVERGKQERLAEQLFLQELRSHFKYRV